MKIALELAQRGEGRTAPNPSVGAVIFRGDEILGRGTTRPPPGAHAEIVALAQARRRVGAKRLRGASIAVTLEPCCHRGRTPPCTDALIEAGLKRVYVGCRDPHPRVAGKGIRQLRAARIRVERGVLETECRHQHRAFLSVCERQRPWIVLKLASTLDGRIATPGGESRWITSAASRRAVHALRAHVDAVMIGSGTALVDDPELSARAGSRVLHRPTRVVVDSRLRVPISARLFREEPERSWLLCARGARGARVRERLGARILPVRRAGSHLDLRRAARRLAAEGLTSVLVEGGGGLAAALLRAGLVDEIHWFIAPMLVGGDGRAALGPLALRRLADATRLDGATLRRRGGDIHLHALLTPRGRAARRSR